MSDDWHRQELFKGMLSLIVEAMKMIAWINGGAAIAVVRDARSNQNRAIDGGNYIQRGNLRRLFGQ